MQHLDVSKNRLLLLPDGLSALTGVTHLSLTGLCVRAGQACWRV
jgi:hypothetical protein